MEKETNQAIPLGGSTSDGGTVVPSASNATVAVAEPAQLSQPPAKKNNAIVFVILGLAALLFVCAIGAGVLFLFATTDTMPKAPEVTTDMNTVIKDSALEMLSDKKISLNSDEINLFLQMLVEKSSEKLAENGVQINDFFSVVANDKITFYCRLNYKGVTWPVKAVADVRYDDPYIIIGLKNANLGKLDLPPEMVLDFFGKYYVSDNITMRNGFIYYDTTDFNDQISAVALSSLGLTPDSAKTDTDDGENKGFSIKRWWKNLVGSVSNSVKNWAAKVVSDFIHNVKFQDVKVIDNQLVISVTYDEDKQGDTASSTDTDDGETGETTESDTAQD